MEDVEVFYEFFKFQDILDLNVLDLRLLKRGALLAQSPDNLAEPAPSNLLSAVEVMTQNPDNHSELAQSEGKPTTHPKLLPVEAKTLTRFEDAALKREKAATLNSLPKDLVVILATCANGALVQ
jgi:hypothetical protein